MSSGWAASPPRAQLKTLVREAALAALRGLTEPGEPPRKPRFAAMNFASNGAGLRRCSHLPRSRLRASTSPRQTRQTRYSHGSSPMRAVWPPLQPSSLNCTKERANLSRGNTTSSFSTSEATSSWLAGVRRVGASVCVRFRLARLSCRHRSGDRTPCHNRQLRDPMRDWSGPPLPDQSGR